MNKKLIEELKESRDTYISYCQEEIAVLLDRAIEALAQQQEALDKFIAGECVCNPYPDKLTVVIHRPFCPVALKDAIAHLQKEPQYEQGPALLHEFTPQLTQEAEPVVDWANFPAYLIDHYEGKIIYEETLQEALSDMLRDPQYHPPKPAVLPAQQGEVPEGFKQCPISGRPFWGNIEHPKLGLVATYGGPFDTYTIPAMGEDGELRCERFDQDEGAWVDGGEPFGWFYEDQQAEHPPKPAAQPQVPEGWVNAAKSAIEFATKESVTLFPDTACAHIKGLARLVISLSAAKEEGR